MIDYTSLAIGIGAGIASGIYTGMKSEKNSFEKRLRNLTSGGKIKISDSEGKDMDVDQLIALLSKK